MALNAIEAVSPAINRSIQQLFRPFRFSYWWRMAVVGFLAGEMEGGGGFNGINIPQGGGERKTSTPPDSFLPPDLGFPGREQLMHWLPWILLGMLALTVLVIFFIYLSSRFRFILFDSVLTGRCSIRQGWSRWSWQATHYFLWLVFWELASLAVVGLVIGLPLLMAWRAGIFHHADQHVGLLIIVGLALLLLFLLVAVASVVVSVLAKDFLVPIMALQGLGFRDGWRRLGAMMKVEKRHYAGYIGMKIVLSLLFDVVLGIIGLVLVLVFALVVAVIAVPLAALISANKSALLIAIAVVLGVIAACVFLFISCLLTVPEVVFFQAYSLHFFVFRFRPLQERMFRRPPTELAVTPLPSPAF